MVQTFYPSSYGTSLWTNPQNAYANDGAYVTYAPPTKNNLTSTEYDGFDFSAIPNYENCSKCYAEFLKFPLSDLT